MAKNAANFGGIIACLGNPGPEYAATRHNFGFMVADALLEACGPERCTPVNLGDDCQAWDCAIIPSRPRTLVVKPLTYMNRSGQVTARLCRKFGIAPSDLVVIYDEMDLPLGRVMLKLGGGTAGHNGVQSVVDELGSKDFYRLRMGMGRPADKNVVGYVLTNFNDDEVQGVEQSIKHAVKGVQLFLRRGAEDAKRHLNSQNQ